jgi:hypothetical protein
MRREIRVEHRDRAGRAGGVEGARAIEPLCRVWCASGFLHNQWTHAYKVLKR